MHWGATLACHLDRFLIKQTFHNQMVRSREWVGRGGTSNHSLVYLDFLAGELKPYPPFKFNARWLHDPEFHQMVTQEWKHCNIFPDKETARVFNENLKRIKAITIHWARRKKKSSRRRSWIELNWKSLSSLIRTTWASVQCLPKSSWLHLKPQGKISSIIRKRSGG